MYGSAKFLLLGMLTLFGMRDVTSEVARLSCAVSAQTDNTYLYLVKVPRNSHRSKTSWETRDGTKIAEYPDYDQTLVKDLTSSSITTNICVDYLHFSYREEWNGTDDEERWSEAICEANCNDSSSSEQISAQTRQSAHWISVGVAVIFPLLLID